MSIYASYPVNAGGSGIPTYATFADFPSAATAGNGALAIALDTDTLYISNGTSWLAIGSGSTVLTVGTIDSEATPSANAATITSNALIMQSASSSVPGVVNNSAQTFSGVKTFSSAPNLSSLTASLPLQLDGSKNIISSAIDLSGSEATGILAAARFPALTGDVTTVAGALATSLVATSNGTLTTLSALTTAGSLATVGTITSGTWNGTTIAINHGGTGQTSASAAFNALNPMTTTGDIIYESGSNVASRLAIGSTGNVLTVSAGIPAWAAPATSGTVTSVGMSVPSFLSVSPGSITTSGTFAVTYSGTALPVANGGTGLTSGTSGGILGFTATGTLASSAALTANQLVIGGGAGATPTALAAGTQYQVLTMGAANPGYGAVNLAQSAAVSGVLGTSNGGLGSSYVTPTQQRFTSSSGTYTTPTGVKWIRVRMVGGGGGGCGGGSAGGTAATNGTSTTFGTSLLTATGGTAGGYGNAAIPAPGSGTINSPAFGTAMSGGAAGSVGADTVSLTYLAGSPGGSSYWGGSGGNGSGSGAGGAAASNSGSGGGGGGSGSSAGSLAGGGGSAGGFIDAIIGAPSASYSYGIGSAGSGGGAGTNGNAGGNGAAGYIEVTEYYV